MEEDRTYIPNEQEEGKREEEEKDTGISPSVLDVRDYFDQQDSPEEAEEEGQEPGSGENGREEEGKEGQEEEPQEGQEEEAAEGSEEKEHPQDDEEEMFQDRRGRNIYTEEELAGLEEEEPEEEAPELLIDEDKERKKKEAREAQKRRQERLRDYSRTHGKDAQGVPVDAAGIDNGGTGMDGDAFYEERIRHAYAPRKEDAGGPMEPAGRGRDLPIEEGDASVGPARAGQRGAGAGTGRRGFPANNIQPGRHPKAAGAEGISPVNTGADGDAFYEERIRHAYGPRKENDGGPMEPAGRGGDLLIEEGDASVAPPRAGQRGAGTGTGRRGFPANNVQPGRHPDAAGAEGISPVNAGADGDAFYEERIRHAYGPRKENSSPSMPSGRPDGKSIPVIEEREASFVPGAGMEARTAGSGYTHPADAGNKARDITASKTGGISMARAGAEPLSPEGTGNGRAGHPAAGKNTGISDIKKKTVLSGSLKSITVDEGLPKEAAKTARDASGKAITASQGKPATLEGKGKAVPATGNGKEAVTGALSAKRTAPLQPAGKPGASAAVRGGEKISASAGTAITAGQREKPGAAKKTGTIAGSGIIKAAGTPPVEGHAEGTGDIPSAIPDGKKGTSAAVRAPSAHAPRKGKGIVTGDHVTGIVKDREAAAAAGDGSLASGANKAAGISSGYISPASASMPGAAGKGIVGAAGTCLGAGILPPEAGKRKEKENRENGRDEILKNASDTVKTAEKAGVGTGDGIIVKRRSVDERLGGAKKTASRGTAADAAGRQESKGLIRASSIPDAGKDEKITAGSAMDREGGNRPVSRAMEESRRSAGLMRRYQAAHAAQPAPMGAFTPAAGTGGGTKLKVLVQALSKKAAAMLLTTTLTAGALAGGAGMASRRTMKGNDNDWTPMQAHVLTTDAIATGGKEEEEEGTGGAGASGTGSSANSEGTGDAAGSGAASGNSGGESASGSGNTSGNATAAGSGTDAQEEGIPLTQDVLEKIFTRMQAYGVLSPTASYSSTAITRGQAAQNPNAQSVVDYALSWVGKIPYKSSVTGNDPGNERSKPLAAGRGSDCSWFVYHVLMDCGVLPEGTKFIHSYEWGTKPEKYPGGIHIGTDLSKAQPGDILCTGKFPRKSSNSHVAIYIGNGERVECAAGKGGVVRSKVHTNNIIQIVRFPGASSSSAAASSGGTLSEPTTSRYGFTEDIEATVEAHMTDFDYDSFDSFMASQGGAENYVRSLGGIFSKWCGVQGNVQTAGQFQEIAHYVMALMTIWGPDYHGGGGDHKFNNNWGKGDQYGRFYKGSKIHHWKGSDFDIESIYFHDKEHIMTDCGSGCSYIMYKAGLQGRKRYAGEDEKADAWKKVDTSRGGTVITRKEDLQVGDLIQMSKTKSESGWKHVCVVGEVYPDGTIITYDTGNRYVNSGNFKKVFNADSDGDFSGDYKGYHSWFGMRMRQLDQSDAQTFGNYQSGQAVENLKEIRINSVKVDGKTKNRNKFSYNRLGEYKKDGRIVSAVNVNFTFVDKNRNDIAGTVLANGNQNDAAKAKKAADKIIEAAEKHKNASYSSGGNDWKTGVDAAHYVYRILKEAGLYSGKERTASGWRFAGKKVDKMENAQKGDIIVYKNHVAIYDGSGKIYECSAKTGGAAHIRKAEEPGEIIAIRRLTDDISGPSAKAAGASAGAGASGSTAAPAGTGGGGFTINIPSGLGATHTYMGWQCITAPSSNQYRLRSEAGMNFDSEGFGVIKGRYVVACTTTYGNVGDCVDFYKKNGQVIHAVIGDIKSQHDAGCTKWGHHNGRNVIEFVVDKGTWYSNSAGSHVNPGSQSCHPEWASETVKAVNLGSWKNNAAVEHPASMASASAMSYTAGQARSNEEPLYLAMQILSMTPAGANSCKNPANMDQYDRYCFDILDWAITESYGADVRYTSYGEYYQCDITVDICCDPAKLQKNDSNFKWWDYKHENGDPQVKSYMDLQRDVYCDVFNVDVYKLLSANVRPFSGNEEVVYEFFRGKGLGPAQIAAIMANIKAESNFNPNTVNAASGASGLFQWLGGRLDALKRMAQSRDRDWTDIQTQLDYAWEEIQGSGWNGEGGQKNLSMSTADARQAAMVFCTYFERAGSPSDAAKRADYAAGYYSTILGAMNPQGIGGYPSVGGTTNYLQWAIDIANGDSHGYSQASRNGNPDYDCSSLVYYALKACRYNVGNTAFYTGSMSGILQKAGFTRHPFRSQSELQPGDILLVHVEGGNQHTEIYAGNGRNVGAHDNYDGRPGDSSGKEISYGGVGNYWQYYFRSGSDITGSGSGGGDVVSLLEKWKKEGGGHRQVLENYNKYASKYHVSRMDGSDQWCSETASAAYAALGLADSIGGMSSNGGSYESKARKIGAWVSDKNYKPKRGDIIITHKGGDDAQHRHTAVVISCDGEKIRCIAGGGSSIHYQTKRVGASEISGYVVPQGGAASSNAGGYGQPDTYYQPQRGWYRPTNGSWTPPIVPSAVNPSDAPPSSGEPTDNDWGVYIGREFHGDISALRGKRQVVIEGQDQSKREIEIIKSSGAKVYSYLSIGSLEDYRPYYSKFNHKKFKLGDYENWNEEQWADVSQKEWRDYVVDHIAEDLRNKGIDSLWLDNSDVFEMYPRENIYQGLLDIVTRLKAKGFDLMYNGGNKFVSRLIREGRTNLVDAVMQEEVYSKIVDYDDDKFSRQDSGEQKAHEEYLDRCRAAGIPVSCLEYTRDQSLIKEIKEKCRDRGYEYYISGRVNLN